MKRDWEMMLDGANAERAASVDLPLAAEDCPLGAAINLIGGRWKLHVLRVLCLRGPLRYNAILRAIAGISAKELTRNLRELEAARLIAGPAETSRDTCYGLTELGSELLPILQSLGRFGQKVVDQKRAPPHAPPLPSRPSVGR